MGTPVTNFGKVTVSTGYDAAATSIVLTAGHGSRLPSTFSYPLTWWDASTYSDPADDPNREIVTVTNRVGDTLTVTRAAESTSASVKNVGGKTYKMVLGITKAMWDGLFTNSLSQSFRGLRVQTHPDNDKALSQVLFSADAIVMDDGQEIKSWSNIAVDLSASGVNGLDTGSEAASTWYSLYAISDGGTNKKGVLHREKDYFLDEDSSAGEDGQHLIRDATARTKLAQGFKVDTAGLLEFVDVKLVKVGTPTGNYWFTVEANSGGVPSNTPLATSDKYDISRLTTTAGWVRIPFRTPVSLSAATQYHLVLQGDFTVSGANHMGWRADTTTAAYANGSKAAYDGATWTADTDDDFLFKAYITRNDVAVTLPTGYTQKAKLSFVYNNGSSNLKHSWARDRQVFCGYDDDWQIGALTSTTATLVDLAAFVPPAPVLLQLQGYNSSAAVMAVGGIAVTDLTYIASDELIGALRDYFGAGEGHALGDLPLEYQGLTFATSGGTVNLYTSRFTW